jgi:hypothetical protein
MRKSPTIADETGEATSLSRIRKRLVEAAAQIGQDEPEELTINDPRPKGRGIQNSASWRSSWSFR